MRFLLNRYVKFASLCLALALVFLSGFYVLVAYESGMVYDTFSSNEFFQSREYRLRLLSAVRTLEEVAEQYLSQGRTPGQARMAEFRDEFSWFVSCGDRVYTDTGLTSATYDSLCGAYPLVYGFTATEDPSAGQGQLPYYYIYDYYDYRNSFSDQVYGDFSIYLMPKSEYLSQRTASWAEAKTAVLQSLTAAFFAALLSLYLMVVCGLRPGDGPTLTPHSDRLFSELTLLFAGVGGAGVYVLLRQDVYDRIRAFSQVFAVPFSNFRLIYAGGLLAAFGVCLFFLLSLLRKIKGRTLFRTTLVWTLCRALRQVALRLFDGLKRFWTAFLSLTPYGKTGPGRRLFLRQLLFAVAEGCMLFLLLFCFASRHPLVGLLPLLALAALVMARLWLNNRDFRELGKLLDHIQRLQSGELDYAAYVDPKSRSYPYELQLRTIGQGMEESVKSQLRSERMKVDLVTNVSHDLRTPLTSLIGYLDLLSRTELSPTARDYVNVLMDKSNRLKRLVSDVFVLAKATGGEDVAFERLDLFVLCEQTLADMEDAVARSGREIRVDRDPGPAPILSDGAKVYRIFQNLIDNALKYSMPGTRVWVSMRAEDDLFSVRVKNTAGYEMDFSEDEILERFFRGDSARAREGSGLGLAIAKSFADQLGGELRIHIDGDQFQAEITFRRAPDEPPREPESTSL